MPCAAHRELAGAHRGLARRAHADRRHRKSAGRDSLSGVRVSVRLRQDQPRDVDPARELQRLESVDHRRGHRLAAPGPGRQAVRDQSRIRLLRRGSGHQCQDQPQRVRDHSPRHDVHQCRAHRGRQAVVGRPDRGQAGVRLAGSSVRSGERARRASEFALYRGRAAESRLFEARRCPRRGADFRHRVRRPPPLARTAGVSSAQLAARGAGGRRTSPRKRPPRPPAPSASCAATRWR